MHPSTMPDVGNEAESAAGGQQPFTGARGAAVAQVVAIASGVLAMATGLLMWRDLAFTSMDGETGVSYFPSSITTWGELLAVAPAGAGALVAVVALILRGRARWLRYLQIGLLLLALASSIYIADTSAPFAGPLYGPLVVGDIPVVVAILLLTLSLHRPAGRQRWYLGFVLLAASVSCIAAGGGPRCGPGSGILTGMVARCPPAVQKASGAAPDSSRVVTVTVQNDGGQTVASQRLPFRTSGARFRIRLLVGTYSFNAVSAGGDSSGDTLFIPADKTIEEVCHWAWHR
jgi:hypothetical protein